MNLVVFGLTISSSWGNGHATLWRGLVRALSRTGHKVTFFERDVPYYAAHRDQIAPDGCALHIYHRWEDILPEAQRAVDHADAAMVTSYCPDARPASALVLSSRVPVRTFYDLDTPVTLQQIERGQAVDYLPDELLSGFDLVLSFTGGRALDALKSKLRAREVAPLYGSVDPDVHRPRPPSDAYRADLSYLGTYSQDRQLMVDRLFADAARALPSRSFMLAGAQYPDELIWPSNVHRISHLPPAEHPAFFASSSLTLNVTRGPMAEMGYCPSGRLFEAAASGVPLLSDAWEGLDQFFAPGSEILLASTTDDAVRAICMDRRELAPIAARARERALDEHSAGRRAGQLVQLLEARA